MNKFSLNAITALDKRSGVEFLGDTTVHTLRNMLLEGGRAKIRGGFSSINSSTTFRPLKLIDNGAYLYGASDTEFKKSLNGTGAWTDISGASITSSEIISSKFIDKLICVNGNDKSFFIKSDTANSLVVDRPDVSGVTITKTTDNAEAREALKNILIYKAVPCGSYIYGVEYAGSKIYKFDTSSNVIEESEDVFTAVCSVCASYDDSVLYVLDLSGTVYSLHKFNPSTLKIEKSWFINITPTYTLTDIHATESKIWIGSSGTYATRPTYTDALAIWNFDEPSDTVNNVTPDDKTFCMVYGNSAGKWEIESIILVPLKMFANGWVEDTVSVLVRAYVVGGSTGNSVYLPLSTKKQAITTGIIWLWEDYTANGGNSVFDGITQDIIPVTANLSDTQWEASQMQLIYDADVELAYIMFDKTLVQAFGKVMAETDGCVNYALNNSGNIAPYYDTHAIESLNASPYFQKSTIAYLNLNLYFFNSADSGGAGVMPVSYADPFQPSSLTYGIYLVGGLNDYYYVVIYITADGETSAPSHIIVVESAEIGTANSVTLSNIPVSDDARTVKKKIYRSTQDGIALYEIAEMDNDETEYTDSLADNEIDTSLLLDETIDNFAAKTCLFHKDRMFYGNIKGQRNSITSSLLAGEGKPFNPVGASPGVGLEVGLYKYKFSLIDQQGYESPASYSFSVTTSSGLQRVSIYLDKPESRFSYDLVKYRIYRTKVDSEGYYYVGEQTLGVAYIDTTADNALLIPYSESILSSRVVWSTLDNAGTVSASDYIDIYPDNNDVIMGFADDVEGIIIFKQKSVYKLYTTGLPQGWTLRKISESNCDSYIIASYANRHYFVSGNRVYRNDSPTVPLSRLVETDFTTIKDLVYYEGKQWLIVVMEDYLYIYDETENYWTRFDVTNCKFNCAAIYKGDLILSSDGVVAYRLGKYDSTATVDGIGSPTTIVTEIVSKAYTASKPTEYIRLRKLLSNYKKADAVDAVLSLYDTYTQTSLTYTDSVDSLNASDYKNLNLVIENMTGDFRLSNKIQIRILNAREIGNIDLMFTTLHRNLR